MQKPLLLRVKDSYDRNHCINYAGTCALVVGGSAIARLASLNPVVQFVFNSVINVFNVAVCRRRDA